MRPTLIALFLLWVLWLASWTIAALWSGRTAARPDKDREWRYRRFTWPGWILLLSYPVPGLPIDYTAWHDWWRLPAAAEWAVVALAVAGFGFTWWARVHLGRLWSASLTRKEGHRVIASGPYAIVRHPIYTGLYAAALATFALRACPAVALGLLFYLIGYWVKAREEERFLGLELEHEAYESYRRRVPMLLPFPRF
jgi:protein-S-isoprenylcysteine O-methyltransferase Ste14